MDIQLKAISLFLSRCNQVIDFLYESSKIFFCMHTQHMSCLALIFGAGMNPDPYSFKNWG